jgi:IS5 family transposase
MGQMGFYDLDKRLDVISGKGDPLELIKATVPWESFRAEIEAVTRAKPQERKSAAGRKAYDAILMFRILVLQTLHNLADEQLEYLIRDRLSFMRFLDLGLEDPVPDATTVWLFREALAKAGLVAKLFALFNQHLEAKGYIARGGQIVDATIVSVPVQRNSRSENAAIKAGKTPAGWQEKPAKNAQKDKDARWTKKHDQSFYGYKNHIGIDRTHKLIRRYTETDASVHDSQMLDDVLDKSNTGAEVWADSAYRSAESEAKLEAKGYKSRVHRRARRNHPLSAREQAGNTTRSRVRARVEHVFGHQHTSMGGTIVRTIGIVRARTKIGLMNLVYNISRLVQLERVVAAPA